MFGAKMPPFPRAGHICDPLYEKGTFPAKVHSWLQVLIGPKVSSSKISAKYTQTIPLVIRRLQRPLRVDKDG